MKRIMAIILSVLLCTNLAGCLGGLKFPRDSKETSAQSDQSSATNKAETTTSENQTTQGQIDGDMTASDGYSAYLDAKNEMLGYLMDGLGDNEETFMAVMELAGITMMDLTMLPVSFFGLGQTAVGAGLAVLGMKDVKYEENGNSYTVAYKNDEGETFIFSGEYNRSADALSCKSQKNGQDFLYAEYQRTDYGYVGQYHITEDDGGMISYLITVQDDGGVLGIAHDASYKKLTGGEKSDYPKECDVWYAVSGNNITGVTEDGKELDFTFSKD